MSKKKTSPKPAAKSATRPKVECAKGGPHEWEQEDGGTYCKKCHEAKPTRGKAPKSHKPSKLKDTKTGKLSAIDAAAMVLGEAGEPMNAKDMIEAMSAKGYWTSPGGKTPHATLYSAILAEVTKKGKESRFKKTDRGHFALKT
jgi:HB1/ASXL restriction endonuclease-like protein with HTH domain